MPSVGMLLLIQPSSLRFDQRSFLVATTNDATWFRFESMRAWACAARRSYMDPDDQMKITTLSDELFHGCGFGQNKDKKFMNIWRNRIRRRPNGHLEADRELSESWRMFWRKSHPNQPPNHCSFEFKGIARALPFSTSQLIPTERARCQRCRIIFRFNMCHREPPEFAGFWPDRLSCAEVGAVTKYLRFERRLQQVAAP